MKVIKGVFEGERALYNSSELEIVDSIFQNGESPIKECHDIVIKNSVFKWKYPIWYSNNIKVYNSLWETTARSGGWYIDNLYVENSKIDAPKQFRKSSNLTFINTDITDAEETLWTCNNVKIKNMKTAGNYFLMNSNNVEIEDFKIDGDYILDGAKNVLIKNAVMNSKDSFWNTENVTIIDSVIIGEYIGWNSKNLTFINCKIESNQGLCYIDGLKMVNCTLENTDLCFELCSNIDAEIKSHVISIKNPISGRIKVKSVGEIIFNKDSVNKDNTVIEVEENV